MNRKGTSVPSVFSRRKKPRADRPRVEMLETRSLLSTVSASGIMAPAVSTVTPDWGHWGGGWWGGGFGGGGFGGGGGTSGGGGVSTPSPVSSAITPAELRQAYSLNASSTTGAGTTIAIVDAYNDPNIQSDLAMFDAKYGLPAANLTVENQSGQTSNLPATNASWSLEIALDVEWAHAAAPGAKIVLVEANSASTTDLMAAVATAAKSANVVSMSWGGSEFQGETAYDTPAYFANPNVTFIAATGDDGGASGAEWPASSPYVVSVGGTTLSLNNSGGYGSESAWSASGSFWSGISGTGGGTSSVESLPSYQATALGSTYATGRVTPDVSLDANPSTGLSVYSSVPGSGATGWLEVGGTSAGTPVWAGIVAAADQARAANHLSPLSSTQTLNFLYGQYRTSSSPASTYSTSFHDITTGANFAGWATKGFDSVTGLGSPIASSLIAAASGTPTTSATTTHAVTADTVTAKSPTATTTSTSKSGSTTTTTTTVTAHDMFSPTSSTTATATSSITLFQPIAPAASTVTVSPSPLSHGNVTPSSAIVAAPASTATPPAQALPPSGPTLKTLFWSDDSTPNLTPEVPSWPGIFVDPQAVGDGAVALSNGSTSLGHTWDAAIEVVVAEKGWMPVSELSTAVMESELPDASELTTTPASAVLAGVAFAIWGTWKYRARRSDDDSRRRLVFRPHTLN
jgi:hypothetical protein